MKSDTPSSTGAISEVSRIARHLAPNNRLKFLTVTSLMLGAAVGEIATIGATLLLLNVVVDPGGAAASTTLSKFFGALGYGAQDNVLIPVSIAFVAVILIASVIKLVMTWYSQKLVLQLGHEISTEVYRKILHQPYEYHVNNSFGSIISRVNKVQAVTMGIILSVSQIINAIIVSIIMFSIIMYTNFSVTISAIAIFGIIYAGVIFYSTSVLNRNGRAASAGITRRAQAAHEGVGGIREILVNQSQTFHLGKFKAADKSLRDLQATNMLITNSPPIVIEAFGLAFLGLALLVLSAQSSSNIGLVTSFAIFALAARRILPSLHTVYRSWAQINANRGQLIDVLQILDLPDDNHYQHDKGGERLVFDREIRLENISFEYQNRDELVLKDINGVIKKGSRTGFLGATGSGKSTLLDILVGLMKPTSGTVRIDAQPLTSENMAIWRRQIAQVAQNIYLADVSIAENIAFGLTPDQIDRERLELVVSQAALLPFISGLPDGFDTRIGERGVRLSGGQRQRLGIARALYRSAEILILDEVTSALDEETEASIIDVLNCIGKDITIIIVTHRATVADMCDQVFRLEHGRFAVDQETAPDGRPIDDPVR